MKVGVLALQGDFFEHVTQLRRLGVETAEIRLPQQLDDLDGLIIPGGESTTIGKLATAFELMAPLRTFGLTHAIWGTCAGAIFLSQDTRPKQPLLNLMEIAVQRNAFGRQADSFIMDITMPILENANKPFPAVFIRAPLIESIGKDVRVLARLPGENSDQPGPIIAAQQGHLLASSFHPEISDDDRFHKYFLTVVEKAN